MRFHICQFEDWMGDYIPNSVKSEWVNYPQSNQSPVSDDGTALSRFHATRDWGETKILPIEIIQCIAAADCVVAFVVPDTSPSMPLELGIAAALDKPTLLLIELENEGPCRDVDSCGWPFAADPNTPLCECFERSDGAWASNNEIYKAYWLASCLPNVATVCTGSGYFDCYVEMLDKIESQIELSLYLAMLRAGIGSDVQSQYQVGRYRIDLAFPAVKLAIECDGHEYHATKEQRGHDAQRDRFLMSEGWRTLRFTGSQIFHNPDACAREVRALLSPVATAALSR